MGRGGTWKTRNSMRLRGGSRRGKHADRSRNDSVSSVWLRLFRSVVLRAPKQHNAAFPERSVENPAIVARGIADQSIPAVAVDANARKIPTVPLHGRVGSVA